MNKPKVVLFDLWQTLICSLAIDPTDTVQILLNGEALSMHPEFVTECLTNGTKRPGRFLAQVARRTGREFTPEKLQLFRELLAQERKGVTLFDDSMPTISAMQEQGIRLGIISNLWPFAVKRIMHLLDADNSFEHVVLSCDVGLRKPDPRIFQLAASLFGVDPADCLMVGDSLSSDIQGALAAGMQAALINRDGAVAEVPDGVRVIGDLRELLTA